MYGRSLRVLLLCLAVQQLSACSEKEPRREVDPDDGWTGVCLDNDGDGYGFQCEQGADCDDQDVDIHEGCAKCSKPAEGCPCEAETKPVDCALDPELGDNGELICKNGTRYCRDQLWSECEGLVTFNPPPPKSSSNVKFQGLVVQDGGAKSCNDKCKPDCYKVDDPLQPYDGGASPSVITASDGGGITLPSVVVKADAGNDGGLLNDYVCTPGQLPDVDCDGVRDQFDTSPDGPPFNTDNKTVFMELDPGEKATQNMAIDFKLKSADIYFYLDMTGTMEQERVALINSLTQGTFVGNDVTCSDRNYDGQPDNDLKSRGVAGAIACLIRDARFGAGWFRDIPFGKNQQSGNCSNCGYTAWNYEMFEHVIDITDDVDSIKTALGTFENVGGLNSDPPEGGTQGLWSLLNGKEGWAGWERPSTPPRICPAGRWGYACFRNGAIPIIIHATDLDMHQGPNTTYASTAEYKPYDQPQWLSGLEQGTKVGTDNWMGGIGPGEAEDLATAIDLGDVTNRFVTYGGDTRRMTADMTFNTTGTCANAWNTSDETSPDAVFEFETKTAKKITMTTRGSRFDTTLLVMKKPTSVPTITNVAAGNNGTFATATDLGTVASNQRVIVTGNNSAHPSVYSREAVNIGGGSGCLTAASASPLQPGSVMKFRVPSTMKVRVSTTAAQASEVALLKGSAREPTSVDLATLTCSSGATGRCNDVPGDYGVGDLKGKFFHLYNGTTNATTILNDFGLSCGGGTYTTSNSPKDAVVDFSLSATSNLMFETGPAAAGALSGGPGFAHGLFVYKKAAPASTTVVNVADGTSGTQQNATVINSTSILAGSTFSYRGNSSTDAVTYTQTQVGGSGANVCNNNNAGAPSNSKDIVFQFNVTGSAQTFDFDTATPNSATGYKTWLSLHRGGIGEAPVVPASNASEMEVAGGQNISSSINGKRVTVTGGKMNLRVKDYAAANNFLFGTVLLGDNCGLQGSKDGRDAVFQFKATSNGTVRLWTTDATGTAGTKPGFRSFVTVFKNSVTGSNRITGDCPSPGWFSDAPPDNRQDGNAWSDDFNVTAGTTYIVVVKEWQYSASLNDTTGAFGLIVEETSFSNYFMECDAGSSPTDAKFSHITATLPVGTYYLVLKGSGAAGAHQYALNISRPTNGLGDAQGCISSSGTGRARLPLTLGPGDYSLLLEGQGAASSSSSRGPFSISMRDLSVAPEPLLCSNGASTTITSGDLEPNVDYYVVVRGNNAAPGAYQVILEDASISTTTTAQGCDDNSSGYAITSDKNAYYSPASLPAGKYYLIVKGKTASQKGWFQVSVGDETKSTVGSYQPKAYFGDGGIKEELDKTQTRVITVWSGGSNDPGLKQSQVLSAQSGATSDGQSLKVGENLGARTPLTYPINSNGTNLGSQVVLGVNSLVNALRMNLTVILDPSPQSPPMGKEFKVTVEAYGSTSNCKPGIIDTDMNSIPDTFQDCGPGAKPQFKVTIENPLNNPVPENKPADPSGGYNMKLLLVGNRNVPQGYAGTIVDTIPLYVIPKDVIPGPTTTEYATSGSYEQIVSSQCSGTARPVWRTLGFTAKTPAGTSFDWSFCGGNTESEAKTCTLVPAGRATSSGVLCSTADQTVKCGVGSYCNGKGVCETFRTTRGCSTNADCTGGVCVDASGMKFCQATSNAIDVADVLSAQQGRKMMRVNVKLNASSDKQSAPTLSDWSLDYYCSPGV